MSQVRLGQPGTRRLGDLLVAEGLITEEQLAKALAEQKGTSEKLGSVLLKLNLVHEEQLIGFLSRQYGLPSITLSQLDIDPEVLKLVPDTIAKKYEVLPIKRQGSTLTLAMADPTNVFALDDIAFMTNLQVTPVVASQGAIRKAIDRNYTEAAAAVNDVLSALSSDLANIEVVEDEGAQTQIDVFELKESADEAPVVRLVNMVLVDAIRKGASDIHWEPYEKIFRIRFRIDGVLHEMLAPPKRLEPAIISRLKIMSNLDIAERRMPQDGRIKLRYNAREIDFRVSVLPTIFGEKAVLRILDKDALKLDLTQLGFDSWSLEKFTEAIKQPYGMVLITGPTGSGKTTTIYACLSEIERDKRNVVTLEDPVEYQLPGIHQVQMNAKIGFTFAAGLRTVLRQDPDVIMVGEVRDKETAEMAIRASLTGHLVLSTLHTNDAMGTITRLVNMEIEPFLVTEAISLVGAQRLVRANCRTCAVPYTPEEGLLRRFGLAAAEGSFLKGAGCSECRGIGYRGRIAILELAEMTPELRLSILEGQHAQELREAAVARGMVTLLKDGIAKAKQGLTTLDEVLRVCAEN